ncbi:Threonylcarbamoyl-AMP synthase [Balamuthia mandrillaris]
METRVIRVDPEHFSEEELLPAIELLKAGQVVAFPTETVYGLGANALNGEACAKIFEAKRRPADNPLIVHVSSFEMLDALVSEVPPLGQTLVKHFWPGPLTILFPKKECVPDQVTAGLATVAVRMPSHPIARKLIELGGMPLAAPSANSSGRPSPTSASHVLADLHGRIPCIIDGGDAAVGVESTVVDVSNPNEPMILRPGGISREQLLPFVPELQVYGSAWGSKKKGENGVEDGAQEEERRKRKKEMEERPPTPGLKYRHYSPNAKVVLLEEKEGQEKEAAATSSSTTTTTAPKEVQQIEAEEQVKEKEKVMEEENGTMEDALIRRIREALSQSLRVGVIHTQRHIALPSFEEQTTSSTTTKQGQLIIYPLGEQCQSNQTAATNRTRRKYTEEEERNFSAEVARGLFKALRRLDEESVDVIMVCGIAETHSGLAVMNRLRKAASEIVHCRPFL